MSKICGECTYLDLSEGDIYGKFYCTKRYARHLATDIECSSFCTAYSRDNETIQNAIEFSESHKSEGCYLTTMLCYILKMPDDNKYLETMRKLRTNLLQKDEQYKELLVKYDIIGPKIAQLMSADPLREKLCALYFNKYIVPITAMINEKKFNEAITSYTEMTNSLIQFYNLSSITISSEEIKNADINKSGHGIYKIKEFTI